MKYLSVAISSTVGKPYLILFFVLFSHLGLPFTAMKEMGIIQEALSIFLKISAFVIGTFIISGVYSLAWKNVKNESTHFLAEAKQYFPHVLGVSLVIGIICTIGLVTFSTIYKITFFPEMPALLYGKRVDANLMRTIPVFLLTTLFVYSIPAIFVSNLSGKEAVANSWRFFLKHFSASSTVIILLLISTIIKVILSQWAVSFEYSSNQYWKIISICNIFVYAISFMTFLTSAQIFEEFYERN